jgi:hypothetical protein
VALTLWAATAGKRVELRLLFTRPLDKRRPYEVNQECHFGATVGFPESANRVDITRRNSGIASAYGTLGASVHLAHHFSQPVKRSEHPSDERLSLVARHCNTISFRKIKGSQARLRWPGIAKRDYRGNGLVMVFAGPEVDNIVDIRG